MDSCTCVLGFPEHCEEHRIEYREAHRIVPANTLPESILDQYRAKTSEELLRGLHGQLAVSYQLHRYHGFEHSLTILREALERAGLVLQRARAEQGEVA